MTISLISTWTDAIDTLSQAQNQGVDAFKQSIADLTAVIKSGAQAEFEAAYIRFEPAEDAQMTLADIASVFTQEDFGQAVDELFLSPVRMLEQMKAEIGKNPALVAEFANKPEVVDKMIKATLSAMVIELGEPPADLAQRLADQKALKASGDILGPHVRKNKGP